MLILMLLASFAEVVSIGAVLPFLGVLLSPETIFHEPLAQPIINFLDVEEPNELILPLTAVFAIAALFSGAMRLSLLWSQTRISHGIGAEWSVSIFYRTLKQPYAVHLARNSSELVAGISHKVTQVVAHTIVPILTVISSSIMLIVIFAGLMVVDSIVAVSSFVGFSLIYVAVLLLTRNRSKRYSRTISREQIRIVKILQEGLGGIRDILIDGTQSVFSNSYRHADQPLRRARANTQIIAGSPRFIVESLGMIVIASLAYFLANREGGLLAAIPVLGALALGAQRMLPMLQQGFAAWASIRSDRDTLKDVIELLEQPIIGDGSDESIIPLKFERDIRFERMTFSYTGSAPWALQSIDLTISRGSRIGIIGETGSGKTTLLDMLMGLLVANSGALRIDGIPLTLENYRSWQARISHVPQSIYLSDASIAENIAFGVTPGAIDLERVIESAKQAQIHNTIHTWPDQYDTRIGERGVRLSGGQRQRIGIARAMYKRADVLIFDEATSALDNDTENAVMRSLESLNERVTVIIVAHRLTTLKNCDYVIELLNGELHRIGSYDEVVAV